MWRLEPQGSGVGLTGHWGLAARTVASEVKSWLRGLACQARGASQPRRAS